MATTIKLKNGSGAPLAGDLVQGEPAFDLTNKRLYTEDSGGTVIEVGTNPTSLTTGTFTSTGIDDNATSTAITIDSSEKVGIGTNSPETALDVSGTITASSSYRLRDSGSNDRTILQMSSDDVVFQTGTTSGSRSLLFKTEGTERMRIDSNGRVGIGTTSPAYKLDIYGDSSSHVDVLHLLNENLTAGNSVGVMFENYSTAGLNQGRIKYLNSGTNNSNSFVFEQEINGVNGLQETMRIDSSGNVGIGTASPSRLLTLSGTGATLLSLVSTDDDNCQLLFGDSASDTVGRVIYAHDTNYMRFDTNSAERTRINSSGAVLVGTTSDSNTTGEGVKLFPEGYGGASAAVGIVGASSTSANSGFRMYSTGASAYRFYVDYAGTIFATSTSISAISDATLKENVRDLDKGLDTINALQPRRFDWKNGDGNDIMGFIAQEVEEVMPELVHEYKYSDEENKKGLKMGDMIPSMVKAIQELSAQVNELKAEVAALKGA